MQGMQATSAPNRAADAAGRLKRGQKTPSSPPGSLYSLQTSAIPPMFPRIAGKASAEAFDDSCRAHDLPSSAQRGKVPKADGGALDLHLPAPLSALQQFEAR
jgi:hypothetical protein